MKHLNSHIFSSNSSQTSRGNRLGWQSWALRIFVGLLLFAAVGRLVWLQGMRGPVWRVQAEGNRRQRVTLRAPRGMIVDRNETVIAKNTLVLVEPFVDEDKKLRERLLTQEQAVQLEATQPASLKRMYVREYPYGPVLSHVLGYVSGVKTSTDVVKGELGIEKFIEDRLRGVDGEIWYERTARGRAQRVLGERQPVSGETVQLTIDAELSKYAFELLGDQTGSVLVTTPQGEVLAAVNTPSYVPVYPDQILQTPESEVQLWSEQTSPNIVAALQDDRSPLLFRGVSGVYPPGSVFKLVTALAGLERGAITATTTVDDQGVLEVGDFSYQNWYWRQFGRVEGKIDVIRALARSNDIFFYRLAEWTGPDSIAEFARWFGYGAITGFEGQQERVGIVPTPAWKQQHFGERWYLGNTYHMGIGQGDVLVTPAQVQVMMNTVATRGRQCTLRVLQDSDPVCQEISLQPETWSVVEEGLHQACAPGGTGYPFFESPYDVICKTGTAEFGAADERGYRRTHGWFTVAVSESSRRQTLNDNFQADYVITVLIESDDNQLYKEGSRDAAPIARELADYLILGVQEDLAENSETEITEETGE